MTKEEFPHILSQFWDKTDAEWDGDPNGDYVMAEHVNRLQDAIVAIEQAIGLHTPEHFTLVERIKRLEGIRPLRVPSVGFFNASLGTDTSYITSVLDNYEMVILTNRESNTPQITERTTTDVYGQVSAQESLSDIQNNIVAWKNVGVTGIVLNGLGDANNSTRELENAILRSVEEQGLQVVIRSNNNSRLLSNSSSQPYNPTGVPLDIPAGTMMQVNPFGYDGRMRTHEELLANTYPLIQSMKERGLYVIGMSAVDTAPLYETVQGLGLLFGIDYLYTGRLNGESLENRTPTFNWPSILGQWDTDNPIVFHEGTDLVRRIPNGTIRVSEDGSIALDGLQTNSQMIRWFNETVPGSSIKEGSLSPDRLSTYDIERVVRLINEAPEDIRIDPWKIGSDDGGGILPENIPASHMIQNVIEAINRKNNANTTETQYIEDYSIKSLDSSKLTGNLRWQVMEGEVLQAINQASDEDNFIQIPYAEIRDLTSRGTIEGARIEADNITMRAGQATEGFTTQELRINQWVQGHDGEFYRLYIQHLETETLSGLRDLHVENLTAGNIDSLVVEAVEAHIATGHFQGIVTKALEAETIRADLVTALNSVTGNQITNTALFGEAVIDGASIKDLDVSKLRSGIINTADIHLSSPEGHLHIQDRNINIYDDEDEDGVRRQRVILGDISEIDEGNFGLVVLGEDGETRLYDHTGVYNAGIHENAISNEKIQEDAVDSRVIRAGAIHAGHIYGETIVSDLMTSNKILAEHILARSLTAEQLASDTITGRVIQSGSIETGHLTANLIDSEHIRSGAIQTEHLTVGFGANLMRNGYDSFEQEPIGDFGAVPLSGNPINRVNDEWAYDGSQSLYIEGQSTQNAIRLIKYENQFHIPVHPNNQFIASAFTRTESTSPVSVRLGLYLNTEETIWSNVLQVQPGIRPTRIHHVFDIPDDALRANLVLSVDATNTGVWFDAIQFEEAEDGVREPGPYRTTATTNINADNIQTGRVDARHIRIGSGTVFGDGDIIDITDEGFRARSQNGWAALNSKGLEIEGGAFELRNGVLNDKYWEITGERLLAESTHNRIEISPDHGIQIVSKQNNRILLDTNPDTGDIRMAGTFTVYDPDNPEMSWTIDERINESERDMREYSGRVAQETSSDFMNTYRQAQERTTDIRLGMKIGYSSFNNTSDSHVYLCGLETNPVTFQEEMADVSGSIFIRDTRETYDIPAQNLYVGNLPEDKQGYIMWDNTHQEVHLIWHEHDVTSEENPITRWRNAEGERVVLNESTFIIGEIRQ